MSSFSYSQIVLPDSEDVCPGEEIEYTIQSSYYGNGQYFSVENGVFIDTTDSYLFTGDSTTILLDVTDSTDTFTIRWDNNNSNSGRIILNSAQTQDFNIQIVPMPAFGEGQSEKYILTGSQTFDVLLNSTDDVTYYDVSSANISQINLNVETEFGNRLYTFSYSISGDQPGWIAYQTYNPKANDCGSRYSEWDTINIQRRLKTPAILGNNIICNNYSTYSVASYDTPSETFTWSVTDGLKIYKNGQYLTTYTGTETSVQVYEPVSGSGNGDVKVKGKS